MVPRAPIASAAMQLYKNSSADEPFFYFRNPENRVWVGSGARSTYAFRGPDRFHQADLSLGRDARESNKTYFFFATFAPEPLRSRADSSSPWANFPDLCVFEPKHLLFSGEFAHQEDPADISQERKVHANETERSARDDGEHESWNRAFDQVQAALSSQSIDKLVLARSRAEATLLSGEAILDRLMGKPCTGGYIFFLRWQESYFFGLSPERLFEINHNCLRTHALAGTRAKNQECLSPEENRSRLERSEKDQTEHAWVVHFLRESLFSSGAQVEMSEQRICGAGELWHLETPITAQFSEPPSAFSALALLHPTPATCGFPVDRAQSEISRIEAFDRGLYAGALGVAAGEGCSDGAENRAYADACVGLRSALLHQNRLIRYAGAGIVPGSAKEAEFRETERKLHTIGRLLQEDFSPA